jgi:hypothetical protein
MDKNIINSALNSGLSRRTISPVVFSKSETIDNCINKFSLKDASHFIEFFQYTGGNSIVVEKRRKEKRESTTSIPDHDVNANNIDNDNDENIEVAGVFKNLISGERLFLKSYIQLWCSKTDPTVRSHVFSNDRPFYPDFDKPGEIFLYHKDGNVVK